MTTANAETAALIRYLNSQRRHILGIVEGLSEEDVRRPLLRSGWTSLQLIHHLALDVERFWFRGIVGGEAIDLNAGSAWIIGPGLSTTDVFDLYRREIELANAILEVTSPDDPPGQWPDDLFPDYRLQTVREVMLHVMTETATHAGHLDIVRELIDGRQWLVLA